MSLIVDKRRKDNQTREEYGSVKTRFQFFSRVYFKSICSQSFQIMTLNAFKQLE